MPIQRAHIVEFYIKNNHSILATQRENGVQKGPNKSTVLRLFEKYRRRGNLSNQPKSGRRRPIRNTGNIERVRAGMETDPEKSQRKLAQTLNLSQRSVQRILLNDLHCKIQSIQRLKPEHKQLKNKHTV